MSLWGHDSFLDQGTLQPIKVRREIEMSVFKGIVHLNIIFSYMKVNKIRNIDHLVY